MLNTTPKRAGMALMALAVSSAGVLATVSPASAVTPIQPPENAVTTVVDYDTLRVQWTRPSFGAEPTYYRVIIDPRPYDPDGAGPLPVVDPVATSTFVGTHGSPAYDQSIDVLNKGLITFDVWVCANNEIDEACVGPMTVTTPAAPITGPGIAPGVYSPFWTVDAFIRQNYLDWLGTPVRFDELSFWRNTIGLGRVDMPPESAAWYKNNPYRCETIDTVDEPDLWYSSYKFFLGSAAGEAARIRDNQMRFLEILRHEPHGDDILGPLSRLYVATYLRNPEFGGFDYWHGKLAGGDDIRDVAEFFTASQEFQNRYGDFDDAEFVALIYRNVLGRNPDSSGFAYWTRRLNSGTTRGDMLLGFSESNEFKGQTERATLLSEAYYAMLKKMPTAAEYDAVTRLADCVDTSLPTDIGYGDPDMTWVHYVYLQMIMNSSAYRGRVDTGLNP